MKLFGYTGKYKITLEPSMFGGFNYHFHAEHISFGFFIKWEYICLDRDLETCEQEGRSRMIEKELPPKKFIKYGQI
jgi:hypothetical protein